MTSFLTAISDDVVRSVSIGNFTVNFYGLIIAAGIYILLWQTSKRAKHYDFDEKKIDTLAAWVFLPALLGARLYHVASSWSYYSHHPEQILSIWQGGMGIYGALLGGAVALYFACKRYGVPFMRGLDLLSPYALLAQAIGRWGNFFNQEGFGPPTETYFKIYIDPLLRPVGYEQFRYFHPTWFYESMLNFLGFGLLLWIEKRSGYRAPLRGWYMVVYGFNRFVVEFFRIDTAQVGELKVAHLISLLLIVMGGWIIWRRGK